MEKQRVNQFNNAPKPQQKGNPQQSHQFCYGEDLLCLGVDHKIHDDTKNKPISNHAKHISKTNTKGSRGHTLFWTFDVDTH